MIIYKGNDKEIKMVEDINFKKTFLEWLGEITFGIKELYYKIRTDNKDRFSIYLYTNNYKYCISCTPTYLGCTSSCRKPKAGEDWTRGNDLPDGKFCRLTWKSIKNGIIKYELEQVCRCATCRGEPLKGDIINNESKE